MFSKADFKFFFLDILQFCNWYWPRYLWIIL